MAEKSQKQKAAAKQAAVSAAKNTEQRVGGEEAKKKFTRIDAFEGIYSFLSLDEPCSVHFGSSFHHSARHALLAAQYPDASDQLQAPEALELSAAMKLVESEQEASDWSHNAKLKAMERIQRDKFQRCEDFRKKLKETGDRDLVWENDEDTFWGSTKGRGQNHLGRILTEIRASIQDETDFASWLFLCCQLESDAVRWPPVELVECKDDGSGEKQVHRLNGKEYFKFGKLPSNAVVAMHPSTSREHAILLHTKAEAARPTGGVAVMDMGSKFGTHVLEPLRTGSKIKLGTSTRSYEVKVNLRSQIEELERQQRELMREVQSIDQDAADPVQAAKRLAKEEATCFVGNLEYDTEKADILGLFQDCGHVEEVRFPGQQEVGGKAAKGIAFVVFDSAMAARRAVGLSGEMFKGRKLKVAPAGEKPKGGGKGKGKDGKDGKDGDDDGRRHDAGSRQYLRDMLDGKWERGVALPSLSPERRGGGGRRPPPRARSCSRSRSRSRSDQDDLTRRREEKRREVNRRVQDRQRQEQRSREREKERKTRIKEKEQRLKDKEEKQPKKKAQKPTKKRKKSSSESSDSSSSSDPSSA
ncbi:unnamed protein product [Symbiodinium microadriaticum]|nr:unnamed protein product [Symbiodinium microadriaticum]